MYDNNYKIYLIYCFYIYVLFNFIFKYKLVFTIGNVIIKENNLSFI